MAKRLTDNINSLYFEAANKMTSKKARRKIVAYVESYDDVFFWRSVLGKFAMRRAILKSCFLPATTISTAARRQLSAICSRGWARI